MKKTDKQTRYHSSNKVTFITLCAFVLALFFVNDLFAQTSCTGATSVAANYPACSSLNAATTISVAAIPPLTSAPCTIRMNGIARERWIQFIPTASTATIVGASVAPAAANRQLALIVYSGSCGSLTQIGCANDIPMTDVTTLQTETVSLTGLTPGVPIYVRVINEGDNAGTSIGSYNVNVCIHSIPDNNEPTTPATLTVSSSTVCTMTAINTYSSTSTNCNPSIPYPSCPSFTPGISQDIWFQVTVPASGSLVVNTSTGAWALALYSGTNSPGCGSMTEVTCAESGAPNNPLFPGFSLSGLTPGIYYIRLWKKSGTGPISICATSVPSTPPPNDEPCGATVAVVNTGTTCTTSNTTSLSGATVTTPTPSCAGLSSGVQFTDVWTQFTATAATHSITITGVSTASNTNTNRIFVAVYATSASTCASAVAVAGTEILCSSPTASTIPAGYTIGGLTSGQTYLIRFFNWGFASYTNTITYCITTPTVANNNECTGAVQVIPDAGTACTGSVSGTVFNATASFQNNGCAVGDDNDDVWYNFTASSSSHSITITNASGSDFYHSVYAGVCGNIGPAIICADPNTSTLYNLTAGNNYFVRIYSSSNTALTAVTGTFVLCINTPTNSTCFNPSGNDFCPNPTSLSQSPYTFTGTVGAPPVAGGLYTSDVPGNLGSVFGGSIESNSWYSFIAITPTHTFNIVPAGACTVQARVFDVTTTSGCCTSFTSMSNFYSSTASGTLTATGLTVGNTYYLMVDGNSTSNCTYSINTWVLTSTLPLEYVSFIGNTEGKINVLEWVTASENDKSKFTLEHSKDGLGFEDVSTINGKGSNYGGGTYVAHDENPFDDITYYRLKHSDNSSTEKYSNIISVNLKNKYDLVTNIHPNPTSNDLYFDYFSKTKNTIAIELVDYSGKTVLDFNQLIEEGQNAIILPLSDLDRGVYILKVISDKGGNASHHKVIKN